MPYEVQGVVARGRGEPVTLETVLVPDPGPDRMHRGDVLRSVVVL